MAAVSVEVHGKRHTVRVSPLTPLSGVVEAALAAESIIADPQACRLLHNKKPLDLGMPLRFANLPSGAKLDLVTGQERQTGLIQRVPGSLPDSPHVQQSSLPAVASPRYAAAAQRNAAAADPSAAASAAQQNAVGVGFAAAAASSAGAPKRSSEAAFSSGAGQSAASSTPAEAAAGNGAAATPAAEVPGPGVAALLGREAHIFSHAAAQQADAASSGAAPSELPDEFYDFTADDYARVARGWGRNAVKSDPGAPLKTAKMRAAEAKQAAQRAGPVPIRVLFADGMALQATFAAAEPVSTLQEVVQRSIGGDAGTAEDLQLYTAPPKEVLTRPEASVFEAGLAPAAVVYAGSCSGQAPRLSADALTFQGDPPSRELHPAGHDGATADPSQPIAPPPQQAEGDAVQQAPRSSLGAKLPKWMKVGK